MPQMSIKRETEEDQSMKDLCFSSTSSMELTELLLWFCRDTAGVDLHFSDPA